MRKLKKMAICVAPGALGLYFFPEHFNYFWLLLTWFLTDLVAGSYKSGGIYGSKPTDTSFKLRR